MTTRELERVMAVCLGILFVAAGLGAQEILRDGADVQRLGTWPASGVGASENGGWDDWTFRSSDPARKSSVTFLPDAGPEKTGAVSIHVEGEGDWWFSSPKIPISTDRRGLAALFPIRGGMAGDVKENPNAGSANVHLKGFNGDKTTRGQSAGPLLPIETTDWNPLLANLDTAGIDSFQIVISGRTPADIQLAPVTVYAGNPYEKKDRAEINGSALARRIEKLDRAPIALAEKEGVYLSWRLLPSDSAETAFHLYRQENGAAPFIRLTDEAIRQTTDYLDKTAENGKSYRWSIRTVQGEKETGEAFEAALDVPASDGEKKNYVSIPIGEGETASRVAFTDLDGDGRLDYVVKTPNRNVDPYHRPNYWQRSEGTFQLTAYLADGTRLWRRDLGWSIEQGIWYSPMIAFDLNGDGRSEVIAKTGRGDPRDAAGRVHSSEEFLTVMDGLTGRTLDEIPWLPRLGFSYNFSCRNFLLVAHLDGKTPFLIAHRGTYGMMRSAAYEMVDGKLKEVFRFGNIFETDSRTWGQGAHTMHAADIDADGRDEICAGSFVFDDDGSVLWSLGLGHPDQMYVGELNPRHDGQEVYLGLETSNQANGMIMVHAATGEKIWGLDRPSWHLHGHGQCADIDPVNPGCECFAGESKNEHCSDSYLYNADGRLLAVGADSREVVMPELGARTIWWDESPYRVLIRGDRFTRVRFPQADTPPDEFAAKTSVEDLAAAFSGGIIMTGDFFGDWREEVVTSVPGELRIYATAIPAVSRRVSLLFDRNYRASTVENSMGYWESPLPGEWNFER